MPQALVQTKFYTYRQNNSGGFFHAPAITVILEAFDYEDANRRAREADLYFNGCDSRRDCSCCGDRWYAIDSDDEGDETPLIYSNSPEEYVSSTKWLWGKRSGLPEVLVVHLNGREQRYFEGGITEDTFNTMSTEVKRLT